MQLIAGNPIYDRFVEIMDIFDTIENDVIHDHIYEDFLKDVIVYEPKKDESVNPQGHYVFLDGLYFIWPVDMAEPDISLMMEERYEEAIEYEVATKTPPKIIDDWSRLIQTNPLLIMFHPDPPEGLQLEAV